ncbi:hypothetical protein GCM10025868_43790 [Angustibacter aerolatus]|uniref:Polyprenyl synthetase family protein n=1 Tax=Angustibacter aerolatus TaxID=1162965 RepID=A0ABQ6JMJ0_9ACTN|nr:hypothetical protein [Angustibacter aerolatus]GMA89129.1 hypothetical protein GCM10025868_43790 [Angustibacter aerolatus]
MQKALDDHVSTQARRLEELGPDVAPMVDCISDLLRGGKRLRPAFCYWAWRGAGGEDRHEVLEAAASLEPVPGRGAAARRRHGRQRHPARRPLRAPADGRAAPRQRLDRRRRALRRGRGDPGRRPVPVVERRDAHPQRPAGRRAGPRPRGVRPHAHAG